MTIHYHVTELRSPDASMVRGDKNRGTSEPYIPSQTPGLLATRGQAAVIGKNMRRRPRNPEKQVVVVDDDVQTRVEMANADCAGRSRDLIRLSSVLTGGGYNRPPQARVAAVRGRLCTRAVVQEHNGSVFTTPEQAG